MNPIAWPNGARVAVAITFDMDADSLVHTARPRDSINRPSTISMLRYGPQVGIPRILDGYRRFGLTQTFFIPAWCIEQHPRTVEAIVEAGHEVAYHSYIHEDPNSLPPSEELYWMQRSIEIIERFTGKRPRGNRSPLYNMSADTPDFLVQEGFLYDSSLMGDDVPYLLRPSKGGRLVEIPSNWATDDWPPYVHALDLDYMMQIMAPERAMEVFWAEFDAMHKVGGGLWVATWHPFVSGRLSRWLRIERMIEDMLSAGDVWFATMEEIANHVIGLHDGKGAALREEKLPFYEASPLHHPPPSNLMR